MMSYSAIIQEDWSDYNLRKMRTGTKVNEFQPGEDWEANYLAGKIIKYYPYQDKNSITTVVKTFASTTGTYKREELVEDVLGKLGLQ